MEGIKIEELNYDLIGEYGFVRDTANSNMHYILNEEPRILPMGDGKFMIAGFERVPKLYICDPEKNTECKKTACQQECKYTTNPAFKKDGTKAQY